MELRDATNQMTIEGLGETGQLRPAEGENPCRTCGDGMPIADTSYKPTFVYSIGRVEVHYPSLGVEKEFAQAGALSGATGTDSVVMKKTLQENRYLARQVCWVFRISGMETYFLRPSDPADYSLLQEALRDDPAPTDMDLVIGWLSPNLVTCGVLTLPVVVFDQLYSFDRASLLDTIPRSKAAEGEKSDKETGAEKSDKQSEAAFKRTAAEVLDRIGLMIDNAGATDEHRALNYLAVRYPGIYDQTAQAHQENKRLARIDVEPAPVSTTRKLLDVIFTYADRATDVPDRYFIRVDVEEEFPFIVNRLAPYYSR